MEDTARKLKKELLDAPHDPGSPPVVDLPQETVANAAAAYQDLLQQTGLTSDKMDQEPPPGDSPPSPAEAQHTASPTIQDAAAPQEK